MKEEKENNAKSQLDNMLFAVNEILSTVNWDPKNSTPHNRIKLIELKASFINTKKKIEAMINEELNTND